MRNIYFIPEKFNDIKLGYSVRSMNPCSPGYPDRLFEINIIKINTPEKVIYKLNKEESAFIIPLCILSSTSIKRIYKYNHLSDRLIHVRKMDNDSFIYTGQIYNNAIRCGHIETDPLHEELEKEKQIKVEEAQAYSDDELDSEPAAGGYRSVNLMDYVDMPFLPGKYEVWVTCYGLESNHTIVEIIIEGEEEAQDSQPVKVEPTKFIPEEFEKIDLESMESEKCRCSPNYPHKIREFNGLKINIPEKILFSSLDENFTPILPVCIAHSTSYLRTLKYHNFSEKTIYIKPENGDIEYSGHYFDKRAVNETPMDMDSLLAAKELQQRQQEIEDAQKLSDRDLNEGSYSKGFLNVNAFNYVDMPFLSGKYEIWLTYYGLESNRAIVEIIVEGEVIAPDSQPVKIETPSQNLDIEELPEI